MSKLAIQVDIPKVTADVTPSQCHEVEVSAMAIPQVITGLPARVTALENPRHETADRTIYVDCTTGSDITGDGSSATPFASLDYALSTIGYYIDGVTITVQLGAGTYSLNDEHHYFISKGWLVVQGAEFIEVVDVELTQDPNCHQRLNANNVVPWAANAWRGYYVPRTDSTGTIVFYPIFESGDNWLMLSKHSLSRVSGIWSLVTEINLGNVMCVYNDNYEPGVNEINRMGSVDFLRIHFNFSEPLFINSNFYRIKQCRFIATSAGLTIYIRRALFATCYFESLGNSTGAAFLNILDDGNRMQPLQNSSVVNVGSRLGAGISVQCEGCHLNNSAVVGFLYGFDQSAYPASITFDGFDYIGDCTYAFNAGDSDIRSTVHNRYLTLKGNGALLYKPANKTYENGPRVNIKAPQLVDGGFTKLLNGFSGLVIPDKNQCINIDGFYGEISGDVSVNLPATITVGHSLQNRSIEVEYMLEYTQGGTAQTALGSYNLIRTAGSWSQTGGSTPQGFIFSHSVTAASLITIAAAVEAGITGAKLTYRVRRRLDLSFFT